MHRFRSVLADLYGERLERVVLSGSRARGYARPYSYYDVAVFVSDLRGFGVESGLIADIEAALLVDTGAVINAMPFEAGSYSERTGCFMHEVRRDGLDLCSPKPPVTSPRLAAVSAMRQPSCRSDSRKSLRAPPTTPSSMPPKH